MTRLIKYGIFTVVIGLLLLTNYKRIYSQGIITPFSTNDQLLYTNIVSSDYAPQDLKAVVTNEDNVLLTWQSPLGHVPLSYKVYRSISIIQGMELIATIKNPSVGSFNDLSVNLGTYYYYAVEAVYSDIVKGNIATVQIDAQPYPKDIVFNSRPLISAIVDQTYDYDFIISALNPDRINYSLTGTVPDSMVINPVDTRLYWVPRQKGYYPITLIAEDTLTHARATQEFAIRVVDSPAFITGVVRDELSNAVVNAIVRISQVGNGTTFSYETLTDSNGGLYFDNIQGGKIGFGAAGLSKIYAYVKSPTPELSSQWFINAKRLSEADEKIILAGDTLQLQFILHPNPVNVTRVSGVIKDTVSRVLSGAKVSFIPITHFIHIGDTANRSNPYFFALDVKNKIFADATALTDSAGNFSVTLPVGKSYYIVAEKDGYLQSYFPSERNVMVAKPYKINQDAHDLSISLPPSYTGSSSISGRIVKYENGLNTVSTVIVIKSPVKRGAGGSNEFITTHTDSNGIFKITNLPDTGKYKILAVPFGEYAPLYYTPGGGTKEWREATEIEISGDVQDIDFNLPAYQNKGIGSIWGKITTSNGALEIPLPGTLVYAITASTNTIAGYAISDSNGYYSIGGLLPDIYNIIANKVGSDTTKEVTNRILNYIDSKSVERVQRVDIFIPPDRTDPVNVENPPIPSNVELYQNFPNPFNPMTAIRYYLPKNSTVSLKVINLIGKEIATLEQGLREEGFHAVSFSSDEHSSGIYFYQLSVNGTIHTRRMVLIK